MDAMTEQTLAAWLLLWILGGMGLIFFAVGLLVLIQERRKKDRCTQQTWGTVVGPRPPWWSTRWRGRSTGKPANTGR